MHLQVPIGNMPVHLVCDLASARVAFVRVAEFQPIFESDGCCTAEFDSDGFTIAGEDYSYNTLYDYKNIPNMLLWLQRQNLLMPVFE